MNIQPFFHAVKRLFSRFRGETHSGKTSRGNTSRWRISQGKPHRRKTFRGETDRIKSFEETQEAEQAFHFEKRGVHFVPIEKITGSVNRYHDFDTKFRPKPGLPRERLERIRKAMREGKPLPPVDLYQIKDEYYILDGNNRVAIAKELGFKNINARIVECIPQKHSWENILYFEKRMFFEKTELSQTIELTEVGQYQYLLEEISVHRTVMEKERGRDVGFPEASADWYKNTFVPFVAAIEQGRYMEHFAHRTPEDFYSYISFHRRKNWRHHQAQQEKMNTALEKEQEVVKPMNGKEQTPYQDMLREITAFVLIKIETKNEQQILSKIFSLEEVREAHTVHGEIDILVKIVLTRDLLTSDAETIGRFVQDKIRKIPGILSSQTLIPSSSKIR